MCCFLNGNIIWLNDTQLLLKDLESNAVNVLTARKGGKRKLLLKTGLLFATFVKRLTHISSGFLRNISAFASLKVKPQK